MAGLCVCVCVCVYCVYILLGASKSRGQPTHMVDPPPPFFSPPRLPPCGQTKDDFGTAVKRWCFPGQAVTIRAIRQQHNKTFRLVVGAKGMSMEEYHALGALVDDWEEFARQEY